MSPFTPLLFFFSASLKPQATSLLAAYRPFLDPLALHGPWDSLLLLPPLVLAVALIYKTLKLPTLQRLGLETLQLAAYILALMAAAAAVLWGLVELV